MMVRWPRTIVFGDPPRSAGAQAMIFYRTLQARDFYERLYYTLRLPDYFGGNADALSEVLLYDEEVASRNIVIEHKALPAIEENERNSAYIATVLHVAKILGAMDRFYVVFPAQLEQAVGLLVERLVSEGMLSRDDFPLVQPASSLGAQG